MKLPRRGQNESGGRRRRREIGSRTKRNRTRPVIEKSCTFEEFCGAWTGTCPVYLVEIGAAQHSGVARSGACLRHKADIPNM